MSTGRTDFRCDRSPCPHSDDEGMMCHECRTDTWHRLERIPGMQDDGRRYLRANYLCRQCERVKR